MNRVRCLAIAVVLAFAFALAAPTASGEGVEPAAPARARTHYRAGSVFFEDGLYDEAIREYLKAYRLHPLPEFLFNLAQAYRLKGDRENAILHYAQFLQRRPSGKGSAEAREYIASLLRAATASEGRGEAGGGAAPMEGPDPAAPSKAAPEPSAGVRDLKPWPELLRQAESEKKQAEPAKKQPAAAKDGRSR